MYLKIISTHHLKGNCESRYCEVATLGEQFRPWDRHRQVLEKRFGFVFVLDYRQKKPCCGLLAKKHFILHNTWIYPSTNSTGRSASSMRQLIVRMLRATLLKDIAPSTESWKWKVNFRRGFHVAPDLGIWCRLEMCPGTYWWDNDLKINVFNHSCLSQSLVSNHQHFARKIFYKCIWNHG